MSGGAGPIIVTLLTGFLGSGKTSLLRRLLKAPELSDAAVLINEFGEVGLDHLLLDKVDEDVVLLQSGCVCCTIRGDLKEAMLRLHGRIRRGEVPPASRLIIETTGLADPAPIVATLLADPVLCHHFRLGNVVTLVDGVNGLETLNAHTVSVKQAAIADRLVISKTDLRDSVAALEARLRRINPTAEILRGSADSDTPVDLVLGDLHDEGAKRAEVARWLAGAPEPAASHAHAHGDVRSACLTAGEPLDWAAFGLWLSMLLNRHGDRILRIKGLLDIAGVAEPVVIHGVQHMIHKPVHLDAWPGGDRTTRLIVIATDTDLAAVDRSFHAFLRLRQGPALRQSGPAYRSAAP